MKYPFRYYSLLLTLSFFLTSCHSSYEEKDGKIYYKWIHGGNWTTKKTLVKGADAETFETIENDIDMCLAKDQKHVFKEASILEYADPNTFEQVKKYYWKDKNNVYLLQFGGKDCRIKNAEPKTFGVIKDYNWSFDNRNVYYDVEKLDHVSANSFVALNENWGKDHKYYYFKNLRLDSLDYQSAEIIHVKLTEQPGRKSEYIRDKNHVFFQNKLVKDANPLTFEAEGAGTFGHDDKFMFTMEINEGPITEQYKKTYMDK